MQFLNSCIHFFNWNLRSYISEGVLCLTSFFIFFTSSAPAVFVISWQFSWSKAKGLHLFHRVHRSSRYVRLRSRWRPRSRCWVVSCVRSFGFFVQQIADGAKLLANLVRRGYVIWEQALQNRKNFLILLKVRHDLDVVNHVVPFRFLHFLGIFYEWHVSWYFHRWRLPGITDYSYAVVMISIMVRQVNPSGCLREVSDFPRRLIDLIYSYIDT